MKNNNSKTEQAVQIVIASFDSGVKGSALVAESKLAAKRFGVKAEVIQGGVRAALSARKATAPVAKSTKPISDRQQAIREYNATPVVEYQPIARPDTTGLVAPQCPKCGGPMHAFFAKDGVREFWGCNLRDCRGIRKIVRPMTEAEAEARAYEAYLSK